MKMKKGKFSARSVANKLSTPKNMPMHAGLAAGKSGSTSKVKANPKLHRYSKVGKGNIKGGVY